MIIGNLTKNPELRTTQTGKSVCSFTIAVNRRKKIDGQPDVDFFRVTAWEQMGENCAKYLTKGKKVSVVGSVSARAFTNSKGEPGASLEVMAKEVEFLSSSNTDQQTGMHKVEAAGNPFDEVPY